jgi:hypothetical protein
MKLPPRKTSSVSCRIRILKRRPSASRTQRRRVTSPRTRGKTSTAPCTAPPAQRTSTLQCLARSTFPFASAAYPALKTVLLGSFLIATCQRERERARARARAFLGNNEKPLFSPTHTHARWHDLPLFEADQETGKPTLNHKP